MNCKPEVSRPGREARTGLLNQSSFPDGAGWTQYSPSGIGSLSGISQRPEAQSNGALRYVSPKTAGKIMADFAPVARRKVPSHGTAANLACFHFTRDLDGGPFALLLAMTLWGTPTQSFPVACFRHIRGVPFLLCCKGSTHPSLCSAACYIKAGRFHGSTTVQRSASVCIYP